MENQNWVNELTDYEYAWYYYGAFEFYRKQSLEYQYYNFIC